MISSKTVNIDNPKLNCRLEGYEKFSPIRVVLDKNLDIGLNTNIYKSVKRNNTIIFHDSFNLSKTKLLKKGVILVKVRLNKKKNFDLKNILKKLFSLGIRNLLIEGGDKITKDLLKNRLINQFYMFKSSKVLSKSTKHVIFTSTDILNNNYKIKSKISTDLAKDKITIYIR